MPPDKKVPPSAYGEKTYQEVFYLLAGLFLLGTIVNQAIVQYRAARFGNVQTLWGYLSDWALSFWSFWKVFGTVATGVSIVLAIYSIWQLHLIKKEEDKIYGSDPDEAFLQGVPADARKQNEKWDKVITHINSINPSDWRVAIIEADIILDELLTAAGYNGDGVGEKLKAVEPSDFLTLDNAWEAHKVRNRIAHSGANFELNEREAKRVIALFESVFKEFDII